MPDAKVALLTYDHPHRKTEDVVTRLLLYGYRPTIVLIPWVERAPRPFLYAHRPGEEGWPADSIVTPQKLAASIGLDIIGGGSVFEILSDLSPDAVVIGGSQLLPVEVVNGFKVVNVHPGLLPMCRGLDILKWSIIEGWEVGVTGHLCDERPDLGRFLCAEKVPIYRSDTFHAFAARQYEYEIGLLPVAMAIALSKEKEELEPIQETFQRNGNVIVSASQRRMPRRIESGLLPAFERYKLIYGS